MTRVTLRSPDGQSIREVTLQLGESLMKAAVMADVPGIEAECGGCLSCATCHVYVEAGSETLLPPSEDESAMLDFVAAERQPNSRLSCQIVGSAEAPFLVVQVPDRQV